MAKIIKKAKTKKAFKVGDIISWTNYWNDGRCGNSNKMYGSVVKVCPVNLHVEDYDGNVWSVSKEEAY
jgi:hypothetical protein